MLEDFNLGNRVHTDWMGDIQVFFSFFRWGDALKFGPLCASASQNMLSYGEGRLELNNGCTGICLNDKCVMQLPHLVGVGSNVEAHAHRTPTHFLRDFRDEYKSE